MFVVLEKIDEKNLDWLTIDCEVTFASTQKDAEEMAKEMSEETRKTYALFKHIGTTTPQGEISYQGHYSDTKRGVDYPATLV